MERRTGANEMSGGLWVVGLAAAAMTLVGMTAPTGASAQWNPRARPQFGHIDLRQGFMPDPRVMTGTLGGPVNASQINGSCRGLITPNPSHIIRSRTGFRNIRFVVDADRDATLVVMLPDGRIICDDDGGEGVNPLVQTSARRGNIAVWVGAYSRSYVGASYRLGVTELNHISARNLQGGGPPPGVQIQPAPQIQAANGLNPRMAPAYGQINLRAGFMPDPAIVSGQPGGPVRGSDVARGCRGYYSPQPNHVINTQTGFRNIRFIVNSSVDLTLAVMTPDGRITCDDDGGAGANPLVQTNSPPGAIRVWVGTYSQSRSAPYNMGVSELTSIGTNNIPRPGQGGVVVGPGPGPGPVAPPQVQADVVQMTVGIPVTLMGPGMSGNTVAMWQPRGGRPTQVRLQGRALMAGNVNLAQVPPGFRDPVITVQQQRNGNLVARAEQPPQGRGDRGQVLLLEVRWQGGRPSIANRWSGTAVQRGPRWSR